MVDATDHPDLLPAQRVSTFQTEADFQREFRAVATTFLPVAERWFEQIVDERSVLAAYEDLEARPSRRFGFDNNVRHRLGMAFVLARLCLVTEAHAQLDEWWTRTATGIYDRGGSTKLLDQLHALVDEAAEGGQS